METKGEVIRNCASYQYHKSTHFCSVLEDLKDIYGCGQMSKEEANSLLKQMNHPTQDITLLIYNDALKKYPPKLI